MTSKSKLVSVMSSFVLALAITGCATKKFNVNGPNQHNEPEGKLCPPTEGMISDNENGANTTNTYKGRGGYWYTFVDDKGSQITPMAGSLGGTFQMTEGGAKGTKYAARMWGQVGGGDVIYAGMGLNFLDPKGDYNASAYKGISFWAKKAPGTTPNVRLKVPDAATDPEGKICTACFNDFGYDLKLTDEWTEYTIPFRSMKQIKGWGSPHTKGIDSSKIYGMQWQVNEPNAKFDVWVDEIQFTGCP